MAGCNIGSSKTGAAEIGAFQMTSAHIRTTDSGIGKGRSVALHIRHLTVVDSGPLERGIFDVTAIQVASHQFGVFKTSLLQILAGQIQMLQYAIGKVGGFTADSVDPQHMLGADNVQILFCDLPHTLVVVHNHIFRSNKEMQFIISFFHQLQFRSFRKHFRNQAILTIGVTGAVADIIKGDSIPTVQLTVHRQFCILVHQGNDFLIHFVQRRVPVHIHNLPCIG